jgi:hypothetical protein
MKNYGSVMAEEGSGLLMSCSCVNCTDVMRVSSYPWSRSSCSRSPSVPLKYLHLFEHSNYGRQKEEVRLIYA